MAVQTLPYKRFGYETDMYSYYYELMRYGMVFSIRAIILDDII